MCLQAFATVEEKLKIWSIDEGCKSFKPENSIINI
jgi:hypothetical protein